MQKSEMFRKLLEGHYAGSVIRLNSKLDEFKHVIRRINNSKHAIPYKYGNITKRYGITGLNINNNPNNVEILVCGSIKHITVNQAIKCPAFKEQLLEYGYITTTVECKKTFNSLYNYLVNGKGLDKIGYSDKKELGFV